MTRPPPPHGFPRRRSVLRALGAAALRLAVPAAAGGAAAVTTGALGAEPELTQFEISRDDEASTSPSPCRSTSAAAPRKR